MHTHLTRVAAIAVAGTLLLSGCGLTRAARDVAEAAREMPEPPAFGTPGEVPDLPDIAAPDTPDGAAPDTADDPGLADRQPDRSGTPDVCDLLTAGEVEEALGQPVEASALTDSDCTYSPTDNDAFTVTEVTLSILRPIGGSPETLIQTAESAAGSTLDSRRIDGLGDGAIILTGPQMALLSVKTSDAWVSLSVFGEDEPARAEETVTRLMDHVVQRLT